MTSKAIRIGTKGQVIIRKDIRDQLGLEGGTMVEEEVVGSGVLIKPVQGKQILREMEELSQRISKKWPKGLTAVEAVRRERR